MKINREPEWTTPAEGGNPRALAFKSLEMSIRRAYQLNSGLIDALSMAGDMYRLKQERVWMIIANKDLREALGWRQYGSEHAAIAHQEVWEWIVEHWYSGGLKRSVIAMMENLTDANKKTIKGKVKDLYG